MYDEEGLLPDPGAACQEDQSEAIAVGELGSFHLAVEHDELLSQQQILSDEVGAAAGDV